MVPLMLGVVPTHDAHAITFPKSSLKHALAPWLLVEAFPSFNRKLVAHILVSWFLAYNSPSLSRSCI